MRNAIGQRPSAPSSPDWKFRLLQTWEPEVGHNVPVASKVTPAAAVAPNGVLHLLVSEYANPADGGDGSHRLAFIQAPKDPEDTSYVWRRKNVTWLDEVQGHHPNWLKRPEVDSRPKMLFLPHMQGGTPSEDGTPSHMTPLSDGRGYFMAWWEHNRSVRYFLTEGCLDTIFDDFEVGNFRYLYAAGTVPTTSTPSATVFKQHAHLVTTSSTQSNRIRHWPWADGLAPSLYEKRDFDDGAFMAKQLCEIVKKISGSCSAK